MIIENIERFNRFTLLGVKTRKEGEHTICAFPVAREDAEYFALECEIVDELGSEMHEFDNDICPEVWADIIIDQNPWIETIGLEVLL